MLTSRIRSKLIIIPKPNTIGKTLEGMIYSHDFVGSPEIAMASISTRPPLGKAATW